MLTAGRIDILVNNAATVEPLGPTIGVAAADLRLAFEVNVVAPAALTAAVLPGMLDGGWGRVVNVSSGIAAPPAGMVRGNAHATTKAALEAHTVNLAAELAGTGVTINAYRPGGVDTAMQAWIRSQDPERIGAGLHERFNNNFAEGTLIIPGHSAAVLSPAWPATAPGPSGTSAPPRSGPDVLSGSAACMTTCRRSRTPVRCCARSRTAGMTWRSCPTGHPP